MTDLKDKKDQSSRTLCEVITRDIFNLLTHHGLIRGLIRSELINQRLATTVFNKEDKLAITESIKKSIGVESDADLLGWAERNNTTTEELINNQKKDYLYIKHCLERHKVKQSPNFCL